MVHSRLRPHINSNTFIMIHLPKNLYIQSWSIYFHNFEKAHSLRGCLRGCYQRQGYPLGESKWGLRPSTERWINWPFSRKVYVYITCYKSSIKQIVHLYIFELTIEWAYIKYIQCIKYKYIYIYCLQMNVSLIISYNWIENNIV